MKKYLAKRVFYMALTLFLVATITFFLMKLMPGTPYSNQEKMTPEQIQIMNQQYGLDKPVWMQYLMYLGGMLHGDMGTSFQFSNQPVSYLIATRIGASAQLGIQAMIFGVFFGIILGSIAAINRNTWVDTLVTVLSIIGKSVPNFVLAVLLQYYIALKLGILPIADWGGFSYTILPTIALGVGPLARAKGLSKFQIVYHHALRNSLIPLITLIGPYTVSLMTGSMVIENIFSIPGIGEQFVKSITTNDYPTIMGVTMLFSAGLVAVILLTDIIYGIIDPRIRLAGNED